MNWAGCKFKKIGEYEFAVLRNGIRVGTMRMVNGGKHVVFSPAKAKKAKAKKAKAKLSAEAQVLMLEGRMS